MSSKARELANLGSVTSRLEEVGNTDGALSNRNLIINGTMQVAQRGTTSTAEDFQTVDRFRTAITGSNELTFTQSQDTDAPDGFSYSYKFTVTTPETSWTANEWVNMLYAAIEGQDLQSLAYGTSAAKQITLSFWVKSNITGTYALLLYRQDSVRGVTKNYTIDAVDTWEYKTITFDGDTSVGINNDNARGIQVYWPLSAGPDRKTTAAPSWQDYDAGQSAYGQTADVAGTTGGYFQFTGVQLEVGDTATPFEHRSYGQELALCQRYYYAHNPTNGSLYGFVYSSSNSMGYIPFPTTMRATPSVTRTVSHSGTLSDIRINQDFYQWYVVGDTSTSCSDFTADAEL